MTDNTPKFITDAIKQSHLLIGGTTGSGKSVLLNQVIYTIMSKSPRDVGVILLDPKGVELIEWLDYPQTIKHSDNVLDCIETLESCVELMDKRFNKMREQRLKQSNKRHIYVIIDEWIDLITQYKKLAETPLIRLIAKGRACNIHVILCTQRCTKDIITGTIKANLTSTIALRTINSQESRNILGCKGAESLPVYGNAIILYPGMVKPDTVKVPSPVTNEQIDNRLRYWGKWCIANDYKK